MLKDEHSTVSKTVEHDVVLVMLTRVLMSARKRDMYATLLAWINEIDLKISSKDVTATVQLKRQWTMSMSWNKEMNVHIWRTGVQPYCTVCKLLTRGEMQSIVLLAIEIFSPYVLLAVQTHYWLIQNSKIDDTLDCKGSDSSGTGHSADVKLTSAQCQLWQKRNVCTCTVALSCDRGLIFCMSDKVGRHACELNLGLRQTISCKPTAGHAIEGCFNCNSHDLDPYRLP